MAKLTQELRRRILNQLTEKRHADLARTSYLHLDPVPEGAALHEIIQGAPEYKSTTNYADLTMVDHVSLMTPDEAEYRDIPVDPPIPVIKRGKAVSAGWEFEDEGDFLVMRPHKGSERHSIQIGIQHLLQEYKSETQRELNKTGTLAQLIKERPEWADLPAVIAARTHEIEVRKAAALARKNAKPLEKIEVADTNTAIAKARLLGAKYA